MNQDNDPVDISPYMDNSVLARVSDWVHRKLFQPIDNAWERLSAYMTRRAIEKELSRK